MTMLLLTNSQISENNLVIIEHERLGEWIDGPARRTSGSQVQITSKI